MAWGAASQNNILAGSFLLLGVGLAVWASTMLSRGDGIDAATPYRVRFSIADGAAGILQGSPVNLGGQQVGSVVSVEPVKSTDGSGHEVITGWDLLIRVRQDIALYENAVVFLERPLLGSVSAVNIAAVGSGAGAGGAQGASARLEPGEVISGYIAPPAFLAQAGLGPEQRTQIQQMIEKAASVVDEADKLFDELAPKIRESTASLASMVDQAESKWPLWLGQVDGVLADAKAASARLEPTLASADEGVAEARAVISSVQEAIDANRPGVDRIVANVDKASERVAGPTLDRLDESLADAQKALEGVRVLAVETGDLLVEQTPSIRKALANMRLASDQLRLVMTEIRSQPWRLLVRPDTRELQQQLLYDSARSYASAVSDLRAATESLEAVARQSDGAPGLDRQSLAELQTKLRQAFDDYQQREREFLDRLIKGR